MSQDTVIKKLASIGRQIEKIVSAVESKEDKLLVIQFGERKLAELKAQLGK